MYGFLGVLGGFGGGVRDGWRGAEGAGIVTYVSAHENEGCEGGTG